MGGPATRVTALLFIVWFLNAWSEAQVVPKLQFGSSPVSQVSLAQFSPQQFPVFTRLFDLSPEYARVQQFSFVVLNQSDRAIIGIAFQYRISDETGGWVPFKLRTHSFLSVKPAPLALPHGNLLVIPGAFFSESDVNQPGGLIATVPGEHIIGQFTKASNVYVEIDSIIFADGEVVGLDQLRLAADIQARKAAADEISKQVRTARFNGQDPLEAVRKLKNEPRRRGDLIAKHISLLGGELLWPKHFEQTLQMIQNIPAPPLFFRKDGRPL